MFTNFSPEIIDILMGIRLNNNKEWFDAHKDDYKRIVHEPMVAFANALYDKFHNVDGAFDAKPKVARAYRDTRFTKNKERYKDCKWFFLRSDGQSGITHERPTFFFEIKPEHYWYGFGYWTDAAGMAAVIKRIEANPAEAEELAAAFNAQDTFSLSGDYYKKSRIDKTIVTDAVYDWCQRKNFTFNHSGPNEGVLFERELLDVVFNNLMSIYPLYKYFDSIAKSRDII